MKLYNLVGGLLSAVLGLLVIVGSLTQAASSSCSELIAEGGFEAGGAAWQTRSSGGYALISSLHPHSGLIGAYLGGYDNADDELAQTINLPADSVVSLTFWWQITTEETSHPWDTLDVTVLPVGAAAPDRLLRLDDGAPAGVWQEAILDLSHYAGETIRLAFHARTDEDRPTEFYLDDVSVQACGASTPTVTPTARPASTSTPSMSSQASRRYLPLIANK